MLEGIEVQLHPIAQTELVINRTEVIAQGVLRDEQAGGQHLVAGSVTGQDDLNDLAFALCQGGLPHLLCIGQRPPLPAVQHTRQ